MKRVEGRDATGMHGAAHRFREVFADRNLDRDPSVRDILARVGATEVHWVDGKEGVEAGIRNRGDGIRKGKRTLYLTRHKGEFLKRCPASPGQVCCGYWVLNLLNNCPYDCTYCILQSYLNFQPLTVYVNFEEAVEELRTKAGESPGQLFRVGTGELGDSLALEPWIPLSRNIIRSIQGLDNVVLELKTKSANVDSLLDLDHRKRVIVSWSMGTERWVGSDEPGTVPVGRRLEAAKKVEERAYPLGFHLDPIIHYGSWEYEYRSLLDRIFETIDHEKVVWISMGCLRFPPRLKEIALDRFDRSRLFLDEFVPCSDGKLRYPRIIREEVYAQMLEWIRERAPSAEVYLCMENALVWENVFGLTPVGEDWLSDRLDAAVIRRTYTGHAPLER